MYKRAYMCTWCACVQCVCVCVCVCVVFVCVCVCGMCVCVCVCVCVSSLTYVLYTCHTQGMNLHMLTLSVD